jgi:hypothetical protein
VAATPINERGRSTINTIAEEPNFFYNSSPNDIFANFSDIY